MRPPINAVVEAITEMPWDDVEVHVEDVLAAVPLVVLHDRNARRVEGEPDGQGHSPDRAEHSDELVLFESVEVGSCVVRARPGDDHDSALAMQARERVRVVVLVRDEVCLQRGQGSLAR